VLAVVTALAIGCSTTDDRPFVWGYLSPAIFQPTCATPSCHSRGAAVAGLDFSDPDRGYASLTEGTVWVPTPSGNPADGCRELNGAMYCPHARQLVVPHDPAQSRLVAMLRAQNAPRMPPDRPLPETDIQLVVSWINDGARRSSTPRPIPPLIEGGVITPDAGGDGYVVP
jgi:hypothetical protein